MNDNILGIIFGLVGIPLVVFALFLFDVLHFRNDIRRYNKTHTEHQLDENTPLKTYQVRQRDWHLEMFCNEKKGNNQNEK